jgi:hypothetical protein
LHHGNNLTRLLSHILLPENQLVYLRKILNNVFLPKLLAL